MKTIDKIPTTKFMRTAKMVTTGAKVGVNYLNYYKDKITKTEEEARGKLNESNAEDIYDSLSNLKGSALKFAQMLSMEKSFLPQQYVEKFSLSQFSVPPLSAPLVMKTFQQYFGKKPNEIFDQFDPYSLNAASIGQVHKAWKDGKEFAVKIQYPGVAESISSDLKVVKPIAKKMFNLQGRDADRYFKEVENKLKEETDYLLELEQSQTVAAACKDISNLHFPSYYPEFSSSRILTMDYMHGRHLSEFVAKNTDHDLANKIGQALWDFYMFQMHELRKVHADPHPGNFLVSDDIELIALDFGCMKSIPNEFYEPYFNLRKPNVLNNPELFSKTMYDLEVLREDDSQDEIAYFTELFREMTSVFTAPFQHKEFDFSNGEFFQNLQQLAEGYTEDSKFRKYNGNRGSQHFIYMSRTFFGLYSLMHDLKAHKVKINNFQPH